MGDTPTVSPTGRPVRRRHRRGRSSAARSTIRGIVIAITKFIFRRVLLGVATLFVVSVLVFVLTNLLGDPIQRILGREALPDVVAAKRAEFGLDRPATTRYVDWVTGMLSGDPGSSYSNNVPVLDVLGDRIRNSLFLMVAASVISIPLSIVIGGYIALRRDGWLDRVVSTKLLVLASMPEFVVGALLILLLGTTVWNVFPAVVRIRPGEPPWSDLDGLVLPVLTLTLAVTPHVARTMRAAMIEVLESDYIEMARLSGLSERSVLWRHAFPNALGPTIQVIALNVAYLAAGVVIVESLFNFPGLGIALRDAIPQANAPVVQFIAMFIAMIYVVTNLIADVITILVTPRLRTGLR
ncbi:MAG: ABC transporter permease [Desertimonas sp.]